MKELNETIKNIMVENKSKAYSIDEKRYGFSLGDDDYRQVTGVDLPTLSMVWGETHVYGEVRYCKKDEGYELQYETFINDESKDSLSGVIVAPDYSQDWLGMFSTEGITKDKIRAWLKGETEVDGDTLSNFEIVMKIIDEEHHNKFMDYLIDKLGLEYVPDGFKEKCAMDYISDNPSSACQEAISYMSSYDTKEVIKDLVDNL